MDVSRDIRKVLRNPRLKTLWNAVEEFFVPEISRAQIFKCARTTKFPESHQPMLRIKRRHTQTRLTICVTRN